jgi:hypothetical protein
LAGGDFGSFTGAAPPIKSTASQAVGTRNMFRLTHVQDPGGSRLGDQLYGFDSSTIRSRIG